jgi:hypothetical protein
MANTFTLIASSTVGSGGASSITFSSIPSTFTDLCVKFSVRKDNTSIDTILTFNGSSANVSSKYIYATGSAAGSASAGSTIYSLATQSGDTANTFSNGEYYIPNYASTSTYKAISQDVVNENNATAAQSYLTAGLFSSNSAISTVTIAPTSSNFVQYSTAYLYGIKNS